MVKIWTAEQIPKHKDVVKKEKISKEDIQFLKELQTELNTQNNCGTANPRYWGIMEYEMVPTGEDYADDYYIYDSESCKSYTVKEFYNELREIDDDRITNVTLSENILGMDISIETDSDGSTLDLQETVLLLNDMGYDFKLVPVRENRYICPDLIFLTQKAAQEYLIKKSHNHSDHAHSYCLCGSYCPEYERLINILSKTDWDKLLNQ